MEYRVISADNHINEPPGVFIDRVPAQYKDRAPRIVRAEDGGDGWSFDGKPPKMSFGLNAMAGVAFENYKSTGLKFEDILKGNYDGAAHIEDLKKDGVDAAVVFPAAGLRAFEVQDRGLGMAILRAYNDWVFDEFCSADPKRLIGLPMMPVDDGIPEMLKELDRMLKKGARGVMLPYFPKVPYWDPTHYEEFWKALADAGTVACIHRTMGGKAPQDGPTPHIDSKPGLNVSGIVERFFTAVPVFSRIVFTGLFTRHPKLKFFDAEVNGGWVPFWLQMMEQEYERQRHWAHPPLHTNPTEFVGRNLFVSMQDDFFGFELAKKDPVLARAAMFATDYPHSVTTFPNSQDTIKKITQGMDDGLKRALLAGNAMKVFNLG